jgi:hypothetical protein
MNEWGSKLCLFLFEQGFYEEERQDHEESSGADDEQAKTEVWPVYFNGQAFRVRGGGDGARRPGGGGDGCDSGGAGWGS